MEKDEIEVCESTVIHEQKVEKVKKQMPDEEILYDLADVYKIFGDTTRIKILCTLFEDEMCVCDIAATINMTQSAVSHQLRILKQARLIKYRKEGKVVYYSLDDNHVKSIFNEGLNHIMEK